MAANGSVGPEMARASVGHILSSDNSSSPPYTSEIRIRTELKHVVLKLKQKSNITLFKLANS